MSRTDTGHGAPGAADRLTSVLRPVRAGNGFEEALEQILQVVRLGRRRQQAALQCLGHLQLAAVEPGVVDGQRRAPRQLHGRRDLHLGVWTTL